MSKQSRNHHYISQCYLRGFSKNNSKRSKITVIDFKEKKSCETSVRNVASMRDHNTTTMMNNPAEFEKLLSTHESYLAQALNKLHSEEKFDRSYGTKIIEFIAIYTANNMQHRKNLTNIILPIAKNQNDCEIISALLFAPKLIDLLLKRTWRLIFSPDDCPFITSDNPVIIYYKNESRAPALFRSSPGFGMPDTVVIFPVSKQYALMGVFENLDEAVAVPADEKQIAELNTKIISFAFRQIYSSTLKFKFIDSKNIIRDGSCLLRYCHKTS